MSAEPTFPVASELLEKALGLIALARHFAKEGKPLNAIESLAACGALNYENNLANAVQKVGPDLAGVAKGEYCIQMSATDRPLYFASAHELAAFISGIVPLILGNSPPPIDGKRLTLNEAETILTRCQPLLSLNTSRLQAALKRERAKLHDRSKPEQEGKRDQQSDVNLVPEQAAILKTLLQAGDVTLTVEKIENELTMSDKTIRKYLKSLSRLKLVEKQRKGFGLTAMGKDRALRLPLDAARPFFRHATPNR